MRFNHRTDDHGRKEFRERDPDRDREREKERRQREKERLRRQDEERRRRRERQDGENSYRKREVEGKKEKERAMEQKKGDHAGDSSHSERPEKTAKDHKKEESAKRERLRNKVMTLSFQILKLLSEAFLRSLLKLLLLCIRTGPLFSCTSQEPEAAIAVEARATLPMGSQTLSRRKWQTKETTEQISTLWHFKFGEARGDRPARLRAAMWRLRATFTAAQAGLHPAPPSLRGRDVIVEPLSA